MPKIKWSHSGLKDFEGCARRFHEVKVLKNYPFTDTVHTIYGKQVHESAEHYIKDGIPLPKEHEFIQPTLDALNKKVGRKLCEHEMGLKEDLTPCAFDDPEVWVRGIADLLIIDDDGLKAKVVDYKTGKSARYADRGQLELMALALFKHFPLVEQVDAALLFVVSNDFVKARYTLADVPRLWAKWLTAHAQMQAAYTNDVWSPRPSGLCRKHCVVTECPHNGRSN